MLQSSPWLPLGGGAGEIRVLHTENYDNPKEIQQSGVPLHLLQKRWLSRAHEAAGTRTSMSMHVHPCTQVHTPHMSYIHRPEPSLLLQTDYHMHSPSISPSCPFKAWDSPTEEGRCLACLSICSLVSSSLALGTLCLIGCEQGWPSAQGLAFTHCFSQFFVY